MNSTGQIGITVLGATGSIGINTLDVVSRYPGRYRVVALTGHSQVERMLELCKIHKPEYVVMAEHDSAELIDRALGQTELDIKVLSGEQGLETVASLPQAQYVMAAIVGAAGLKPTLAAARSGKRVLLANKEALVMSGQIFIDAVKQNNAELLPIDSEHNAIFQCMPCSSTRVSSTKVSASQANADERLDYFNAGVRKILLTASGGPFRDRPLEDLENITPEQACAHPVWSMGKKISVDSATMMNKGLEVIEACWLFNTGPENIQVVIHPQSVIHSMVEYIDGSVIAQLGNPDMRTPIAHALAWPERIESGVERLDIFDVARLEFTEPDFERFPCLRLAIEACEIGGTAPAVLNAANEIAVAAFLDNRLPFTGISQVVGRTLEQMDRQKVDTLNTVLEADLHSRQLAQDAVLEHKSRHLHG